MITSQCAFYILNILVNLLVRLTTLLPNFCLSTDVCDLPQEALSMSCRTKPFLIHVEVGNPQLGYPFLPPIT